MLDYFKRNNRIVIFKAILVNVGINKPAIPFLLLCNLNNYRIVIKAGVINVAKELPPVAS